MDQSTCPRDLPSILRPLARGWFQAWLCLFVGLALSIAGAMAIADAIVKFDMSHSYPSSPFSNGWPGATVLHDWMFGSVVMLFGFAVGVLGLVQMVRRFRRP